MHTHAQNNALAYRFMLVAFFGMATYMMAITASYAINTAANDYDSPMGNAVCSLAFMMYGNAGRALAILAVALLGIGAMLGKVTWTLALILGIGIAVLFGAPFIAYQIINNLGPTATGYDCWGG